MNVPGEIQALLRLVGSTALLKAAVRVPPDLWLIDRADIEAKAGPTNAGWRLRAYFWTGVRTVVADGKKMDLRSICAGAGVSYPHGYALMTRDPTFLVWMLDPAYDLRSCVRLLVVDVAEKMQEIFELPTQDARGQPIMKNMNLVLRATYAFSGIEAEILSTSPRKPKS